MSSYKVWPSLSDLVSQVQTKKVSAQELVQQSLAVIAEQTSFQAIIASIPERAMTRAKEIDERLNRGETVGRLAGVPFIAKDNFLTFGSETTAASNMLRGFRAPYQATAIERLEAEGAICVAKANLDAFAHGASTENSDFMVTKNPHDPTRVPGGSSGGPAAAVILGMAPFALGSDTGGSIRQPASFCGAVGLKPTYGLVSRSGVIAMGSSLDVVGPLARSVSDAALILDIISGPDELDATTIPREDGAYNDLSASLKGLRLGVIREYMGEGLEVGVRTQIEAAVEKLRAQGADIQDISLPSLPLALAVYYILCPAEVSSNLSRYDGLRYGHHEVDAQNLSQSYKLSRSGGFGEEAKRRIMIGTYVLSSGYYDAYYKKAQTVRTKLINECMAAFEKVDLLVGPVAPTTAFKIGEHTHDPLEMYLSDVLTVAANLIGIPAISLPAGLSQGLPVGLQLMAPLRGDKQLLAAAKEVEEILA